LKRRYHFEELGRRYGFDPQQVEKVCRISDLLEDLSNVLFLRDRLCLYGGTALSLVFFGKILRLSVDIDFNYRHLDTEDWGGVRERVDEGIKRLLYNEGYRESDLVISASYPLGRKLSRDIWMASRRSKGKGHRRAPVLEPLVN